MDRKKKKVAGLPTRTLDSVKDKRFAQVLKNPVYRPVPKKEKKVEIDKRFQSMFTDDRFKLKYKVDKRGRPVETTTDENLRRYYDLEEDEEEEGKRKNKDKEDSGSEDSEEEEDATSSEGDSDIEGDVQEEDITTPLKSKAKQNLDEVTRKKLHSAKVDYARGEADLTESSSEDESSSDEDNDEPLDHGWGEMDKDASRTEESTNRLALCNMDWDRVRAVDLMILLNSFLPPGGVIKSVNIYPSEFGKERMAEEDVQGPRELRDIKVEADMEDEDSENDSESRDEEDEDEEGSQYHREKLRQYQLNRLKYYYAVIEFDSIAAAEKVYSECDGMEYESSAAKIDLRFIPDDMTFEDKPKETCTAIPDGAKYRPRFFTTTALQQVKVDLTWDETDPMRKELTEKIFDPKEKVDDDDIRAYLATSSEDETDDEEVNDGIKIEADTDNDAKEEEKDEPIERKPKVSKQDAISKYKALLQSIETEKKKKENDVEMEITWGVGLKETTEKLVKKKMEEVEKSKRTPWEEQLDKRKEKRSKRKEERKRKTTENDSDSNDSSVDPEEKDQPFSDDDVDVDMTDEFFQSEFKNNDIFKEGNVENKKKPKEKKLEKGGKGKTDAALELLLMDEDDNKRHFSLKQIMEEENDSKSKKKRKNKKRRKLEEGEKQAKMAKDDFEIDVEDNRFAALFNSHHFNVDPSDPNFKKTKAMEKIIEEKQKRRIAGSLEFEEKQFVKTQNNITTPSSNISGSNTRNASLDKGSSKTSAELSYLVKSIKRNTENLKSKKGMKSKHK